MGPAVVVERGRTRALGATRHRALLTVLALHRGARVSTAALGEALWGDAPPAAAATTLQGYVADLRRVLEPRRAPRTPATVLVTEPGGYALRLEADAVDAARFEAVVRRAAQALPALLPGPLHLADPADRRPVLADWRDELEAALGLWRGDPLCDLCSEQDVGPGVGPGAGRRVHLEADLERDRLHALRLDAEVLRLTAALALGSHASATDLARLAGQNPWDERIWALWATALARTGRQAEALARLRELRAALADELGLDPGPDVGVLETAIVRHQVLAPAPDHRPADHRPGTLLETSSPDAARLAGGEPALVGRHEERALLRRLVDRATGGPELLHLTGEHGLGKSRLAREAERYAGLRGFAVVSVGCARAAVRDELWAWRRLASGLREADDRPAIAEPHRPVPPSPVAAAEEVVDLVASLTARRPLLLVLEDLQWADRATLVGLAHLVETCPPVPLLLLTSRLAPVAASGAMAGLLGALGRAQAVHHSLGGLAPEEVDELLAAVHPGPLGPGRVADVARRSEGNPFVVVELARHGRLPGGPLPATVRAVVTSALGALPRRTLDLLAGASLLDPTFDAALLAEAAGLEPTAVFDALGPAVAAGVVREEPRYRYSFEVGVVREALAESLTPIPRARWQADLAAGAARRRERAQDVPALLPCPPPGATSPGTRSRYDRPPARMYPS
nr:BTAD domain-containing putative transcriptional regulator [Nocardioides panaciterrulae]